MKNCTDCKHAEWQRTAVGNLHPSGEGMCKYPIKIPVLPAAFSWTYAQMTCGGYINRRIDLKDHCACYERNKA